MGKSVLQEWVMELRWKEQTALISAIRGVDDEDEFADTKPITKLIRSVVLHNADTKTDFMTRQLNSPDTYAVKLVSAENYSPKHYIEHTVWALRVIAKNHKDIFVKWFFTEILFVYDERMKPTELTDEVVTA